MAWHHVASHLGRTVTEAKERLTATEFLNWLEYLRREEERQTKRDWQMAMLIAEVRRGWVSKDDQAKIKVEDFLVELKPKVENTPERSEAIWKAIALSMGAKDVK